MYPSQQNATDQTANFFWLIAIIAIVLVGIWWLASEWIVIPVYWLRYHELSFFQYVVTAWNKFATLGSFLHIPRLDPKPLAELKQYIVNVIPHEEVFGDFSFLNLQIGLWLRWIVSPFLVFLGILMYWKFGNRQFTNTYSMKSLRKIEQENWPQITPVLSLDLVKEDLDTGPWAMARTPLDFCKEHTMVCVTEVNERRVWKLDRGLAFRLMTMQVGPILTSVDALPIHIKALVVIFVARAERERSIANNLLAQIAASAGGGKLDFSNVEEAFDRYKKARIIKWLEHRHAYVYSFMASLLEIARTDGVLPTAEFLWLKPVDRRLWYVMNSVGRQTAVVEVAGAFAHWLTEKRLGRGLRTPMVKEAVDALEQDMLDTLYIGDDTSWRTFNVA